MRLTLRTLLACLDRVLPPTEQAEIDAKVAGSSAAQQLAARIQRVVRQSNIPSPRLDGRGLAADANSVAEYLDNCLEHDRLETFERICLESDMHLAEVAACHEMLATLARDPGATAPLDAAGRRTLLAAMGHHSSAEPESERDEALATARAMRVARGVPTGAAATPSGGKSWSAWAAALAALALVVALVAVLVEVVARSGSRRGPGGPPVVALADPPAVAPAAPAAADAPAVAAATPATEPPADPEVAPAAVPAPPVMPAEPLPPVAAPAAVAAPAVAPSAAVPVEALAPAPATAPAPPAAPAAAAAPRVPQGDARAIAAPSPPPTAAAVPAPVPQAGDPDREHESLGFVDAGGLLVHRVMEQGKPVWAALAPGATLGEREDLVVPFGSQPDVNVRGVTIRLLDGARAMITSGTDGTPWLELVFGRAIVRSSRRDARLGIKAGGIVGTITAGLTDPAAVSVDLERAPGADSDVDPVRVRAAVIAARGGLAWRQGDGTGGGLEGIVAEGMLDSGSAIEWSSHDPGVGRVVRLEQLPGWVGAPAPPDKLQRAAGEALAARAVAAAPLDQVLREMAADKRVENRVVAAATLALLGEFDACVELLCEESSGQRLEQRQWSKLEEEVVPLALARGANAAERLRRAFEDRGPHGKAETLFAMARGFSDAELAAGAAEALVSALDDADLVVRRYAYKCICDIVQPAAADRLRYRPDGLPELRREGAAWWRGQLQRGLIRRRGPREPCGLSKPPRQ